MGAAEDGGHLADGELGGWDPGQALWVAGVDYLTPWREAAAAADLINDALNQHDIAPEDARAFAVSMADGSATVSVKLSVDGCRELSRALRRMSGRAAA